MLYFDNFFNSPILVEKLFDRRIYGLGTAQSYREDITIMKKMKKGRRYENR